MLEEVKTAMFCDWLVRDPLFDEQVARNAERWILKGDWSYKGTKPILELSDFFPTERQLQGIAGSTDLVTLTRTEFAAKMEQARVEGMQRARELDRQHRLQHAEEEKEGLFSAAYVRLLKENEELHQETSRLKKKLAELGNAADLWIQNEDLRQVAQAAQYALKQLQGKFQMMLDDPLIYRKDRSAYLLWLSQEKMKAQFFESQGGKNDL